MTDKDFNSLFKLLTGNSHFYWQERLFKCLMDGDDFPPSLDLPTGLGKTSVMAIWLLARAYNPALPRRLVYVVDRRVVVDQATKEAEKLRRALQEKADLSVLCNHLGLGNSPLPVSTLRGRLADNREWLSDPVAPAIIVGTIDMVGSRLLFEGYGVTRGMRPFHAGLLGADSLFVLDEAHLCPPFEALLHSVAGNRDLHSLKNEDLDLIPCFRLLSLSATGRTVNEKVFGLEAEDFKDKQLQKRLEAKKQLKVEVLEASANLSELLADRAWNLMGTKNRVLVYCDRRKDAEKVEKIIRNRAMREGWRNASNLLVGARRVREREKLAMWLEEKGFLAGSGAERNNSAFLIATSAGEVGIDLDADHMVCDLVAFERIVQRFGRVNRCGDGDSQVQVLAVAPKRPDTKFPKKPSKDKPVEPPKPERPGRGASKSEKQTYKRLKSDYDASNKKYKKELKEFEKKWEKYQRDVEKYEKDWQEFKIFEQRKDILEMLAEDASPGAIVKLKQLSYEDNHLAQLIKAATTPEPLRPALTRALVDAWSMTSLEQHTGRPEIQPWLRGWVDEDPQTIVAWRRYLPWRTNGQTDDREVKGFFDAAPIHLTETLEALTSEVIEILVSRAVSVLKLGEYSKLEPALRLRRDSGAALVLNRSGELCRALTVGELAKLADKSAKNDKSALFSALIGKHVIISQALGGLSDVGLLDAKEDSSPATLDSGWDQEDLEVIGYQVLGPTEEPIGDWRITYTFDLTNSEDDESLSCIAVATLRRKGAPRRGDPAVSRKAQSLNKHHEWAGEAANEIAQALGLPDPYRKMFVTAARIHDIGKNRRLWQDAMNAPKDGQPYAKTKGGGNGRLLNGYRHEFGSLGDVEEAAEIRSLPDELQDLALHLIASHHGYARPVILPIDPNAPPSALATRVQEAALRFARQQRRWGPWGLAWWEAIFRSADWRASQRLDVEPDVEVK